MAAGRVGHNTGNRWLEVEDKELTKIMTTNSKQQKVVDWDEVAVKVNAVGDQGRSVSAVKARWERKLSKEVVDPADGEPLEILRRKHKKRKEPEPEPEREEGKMGDVKAYDWYFDDGQPIPQDLMAETTLKNGQRAMIVLNQVTDPARIPEERDKLVQFIAGGDVTSLAGDQVRRAQDHLRKAPYWHDEYHKQAANVQQLTDEQKKRDDMHAKEIAALSTSSKAVTDMNLKLCADLQKLLKDLQVASAGSVDGDLAAVRHAFAHLKRRNQELAAQLQVQQRRADCLEALVSAASTHPLPSPAASSS